jgi:hypothetical protein
VISFHPLRSCLPKAHSAGTFNASQVLHFTVSVAVELSTDTPPIRVVAVVVNVPAHAVFGIRKGNDTDLEVPGFIVKGGVVNMTVLVVTHALGPSGPVSVNFTLTVCAAFVQDITVPVNFTVPPRETVDGLIPIAT